MKRWVRTHGFTTLLAIACMALSVQVVLLSRQVRALKAAETAPPAPPHGGALLQSGEPFPPFEYRDADGELHRIDFERPGTRTLLLVSANACPVCPQILPRWQEVVPHFRAASIDVVGVLLDGPPVDGAPWIDGVPLGSFADLSSIPLAKLKTVPITILLNELGTVEWVHYGTLGEAHMGELIAHLP